MTEQERDYQRAERAEERAAEAEGRAATATARVIELSNENRRLKDALRLALSGFEAFEESARGNSDLWMPTVLAMDTIRAALSSEPR